MKYWLINYNLQYDLKITVIEKDKLLTVLLWDRPQH